jgi:hypothetical protein
MTYIEHDKDCKIFKDDRLIFGGGICNCAARYARAPIVMGPHEKHCPYINAPAGIHVHHGICYCGADPNHDQKCRDEACPFWARRKGVLRLILGNDSNGGVLIIPSSMVA